MPELFERDRTESAIAAALATLFNKQRRELVRRLGDPPRITGVGSLVWDGFEREIVSELRPRIERIYRQAARGLFSDPDTAVSDRATDDDFVPLDFDPVETAAAAFADRRAVETAAEIVKNARARVEKVARENRDKAVAVGIGALLIGMLGPSHAEKAAITETTEAVSMGEIETIDKITTAQDTQLDQFRIQAEQARAAQAKAQADLDQAAEDLKAIRVKDEIEAAEKRKRKFEAELEKKTDETKVADEKVDKLLRFRWAGLWITDKFDEVRVAVVCPICKPLHRRELDNISLGELPSGFKTASPPAHGNCRCWITFERIEVAA